MNVNSIQKCMYEVEELTKHPRPFWRSDNHLLSFPLRFRHRRRKHRSIAHPQHRSLLLWQCHNDRLIFTDKFHFLIIDWAGQCDYLLRIPGCRDL